MKRVQISNELNIDRNGLLLEDYIIKNSNVYGDRSSNNTEHYIYFLIANKQIVYIGRSKKPRGRIGAHRRDKEFKRYFISKGMDYVDASIREREYILKMEPMYNKDLPLTRTINSIISTAIGTKENKDEIAIEVYESRLILEVAEKLGVQVLGFNGLQHIRTEDSSNVEMHLRLEIEKLY